ncbi:hypothetical protein LH452_01530 [Laribacter hongkongensis]|uniref:type IV pilin protein n=1 Tax=Laribacter hongkongensis TaxID=168471 RepID=UPI001EFDBB14|nr:type IV pilin protein [Laribacter hongkongensis]MCG9057635.1 hypothetical protein [Laribacter hongkongensis]MCG9085911.1 hypothetical protein [Laribacter hongkongensis]
MQDSSPGFPWLLRILVGGALFSVLMALALPVWQASELVPHRQAARASLKELHAAQLRWLSVHGTFADSLERLGMPELTADGRYRLSVKRDERGLAYNARARAVGIQALDRECMTLLLTEQGPAEGDGQDALCWGMADRSGAGREGGRG